MSAARWPAGTVRLHEIVTGIGVSSGRTWATTNSGPIAKSGCGREARNTCAWPVTRSGREHQAREDDGTAQLRTLNV